MVLLTAVAFSLPHLGLGLTGTLCTFLVAMALGGLHILGKRNLLGPAVYRGITSVATEPWLLLWLLRFCSEKLAS